QMLLRRLRSIMDRFLQPPGVATNQLVIETVMMQMTNLFWNEALVDRQTWGWPWNGAPYNWGPNLWLTNGVNSLMSQFNNPRRQHLFGTHCITNTSKAVGLSWPDNAGIPLSQPSNSLVLISGFDYNPSSGNQEQEYVCLTNPNPYALDLSGWKLD